MLRYAGVFRMADGAREVVAPRMARSLRQMNPRFPVLLTKFGSPFRATGKLASDRDDGRGIRIPNIPICPLEVARRRRFEELVLPADRRAMKALP